MLFNSIHFFWFMLIVVPLFFILPQRFRWAFMLAASYYFYMQWNVKYTILIVLSTAIDYFAALALGAAKSNKTKNIALACSLLGNFGLLFLFKYYNFAVTTINSMNLWLGIDTSIPVHSLLLPVGISFYTFQSLSYTLDVYMGKREPEKHFGIFALYVSFFPQLVAGPIERSTNLMPQFRDVKRFNWANFRSGLLMIMSGLVKKMVIADRLAILVNSVYGDVYAHSGGELALATLFFAFQIYCDFSGYTDIAIGSARIMGFDIMQNFNRPYLAKSVGEFWRRWHISLTTWFRDYMYVPLGGSRKGEFNTAFNMMLVFFVSGVWHGASFNFMIWGLLNGAYLMFERYWLNGRFKALEDRFPNSRIIALIRTALTFTLIYISWVFFRAKTLPESVYVLQTIFADGSTINPYALGLDRADFWVAIISILALMCVEYVGKSKPEISRIWNESFFVRVLVSYAIIFIIIIWGVYGDYDKTQFIYFAF